MQIFKNTLLACSLAVALSPLYVRAEDNAAQAAARAALEQKMRELKGQPPVVESQPAPALPAVPPSAPSPIVAPAAPPKPASAPPVVAPGGASPDLIEQARQATRARMAELQGSQSTAIPAGQETVAPEPKSVVAPETPQTIEPYVPAKTSKEEARANREREAAAKRAAAAEAAAAKKAAQTESRGDGKAISKQEKADAKARAEAEKAAAKQAEKEAKEAMKHGMMEPAPAFAPLEAPASSLPSSKEQRLQDLTDKYKADQISAEEYHAQRAKILAEP